MKRSVSKPFFGLGNPFLTFQALYSRHPAGRFLRGTDPPCWQISQRYRPIAFATESLRLLTCFTFNCGILFFGPPCLI